MHLHLHMFVHVRVFVHVYVYVFVYMHTYVYVHVYKPAGDVEFAGHAVHAPAPGESLYLPVSHTVHVPPLGPVYPALHSQSSRASLAAFTCAQMRAQHVHKWTSESRKGGKLQTQSQTFPKTQKLGFSLIKTNSHPSKAYLAPC